MRRPVLPPFFFEAPSRSSLSLRGLVAGAADTGPSRMSGCDGEEPARTEDASVIPGVGPLTGDDGDTDAGDTAGGGLDGIGDAMIIVSPDCIAWTLPGRWLGTSTADSPVCEKSGFCPISSSDP